MSNTYFLHYINRKTMEEKRLRRQVYTKGLEQEWKNSFLEAFIFSLLKTGHNNFILSLVFLKIRHKITITKKNDLPLKVNPGWYLIISHSGSICFLLGYNLLNSEMHPFWIIATFGKFMQSHNYHLNQNAEHFPKKILSLCIQLFIPLPASVSHWRVF